MILQMISFLPIDASVIAGIIGIIIMSLASIAACIVGRRLEDGGGQVNQVN